MEHMMANAELQSEQDGERSMKLTRRLSVGPLSKPKPVRTDSNRSSVTSVESSGKVAPIKMASEGMRRQSNRLRRTS